MIVYETNIVTEISVIVNVIDFIFVIVNVNVIVDTTAHKLRRGKHIAQGRPKL